MTDQFEDQLGRTLRQHADHAVRGRDLTGAAIDRARRIRGRRRAATVTAGLALIAATIPVTLNLTGGDDRTEPINTPTPTVEETAPPTPTEDADAETRVPSGPIEVDLAELPSGDPPDVPYVDTGAATIVDGEARVPFEENEIDSIRQVTGGYLINVYGGTEPGLFLVGDDGGTQRLSTSTGYVASSADGGQSIAWSEHTDDGSSSTLVLADGMGNERYRAPVDYSVNVWGFLRGRVLIQPTEEQTAQLWNPETGDITDVEGAVGALATDGAEQAAIITEFRGIEERPCTAVVDTAIDNRELWSSCEQRVETFSPYGRYISTIDAQTDGLGPPEIRVTDLSSGRELLTLRADLFQRTSWEADGSLLAEVVKDNQQAIVRCDLEGSCELATSPRPYDLDALSDPRPYVLNQR